MGKHRIAFFLTLLLTCLAQTAHAFFDPPWITPATPRAGETVSVNIRGGVCDSIFERQGFPQITQEGNAIRLLEYGHHWDTAELCVYDIGTLTEPLGAFPSGDYTLTVEFIYLDGLSLEYTTVTLGVIPFTVTGAVSTAPVPMFSLMGLLGLAFVLSSLALRVLWARHRDTF